MNILMIIDDAPYGSEHMYNALRLAGSLAGWLDDPLVR
jgi:sulfur relay (sulfurtransferase) complex TusBCD TusD component (DsrE family)